MRAPTPVTYAHLGVSDDDRHRSGATASRASIAIHLSFAAAIGADAIGRLIRAGFGFVAMNGLCTVTLFVLARLHLVVSPGFAD